jgi:hypothetical protein
MKNGCERVRERHKKMLSKSEGNIGWRASYTFYVHHELKFWRAIFSLLAVIALQVSSWFVMVHGIIFTIPRLLQQALWIVYSSQI